MSEIITQAIEIFEKTKEFLNEQPEVKKIVTGFGKWVSEKIFKGKKTSSF